MKKKHLLGAGAAFALAVLLLPDPAPAELRSGLRDRGRHWDGRSRDRVRFRGSFGIWLGPTWDPWWWGPLWYPGPTYYPAPYRSYDSYDYYRPPAAAQPPRVYDRPAPESPQARSSWYRCENPAGYYPYVRECPGGWTQVPLSPEAAPPQAATPGPPPAAEPPQPPQTEKAEPVPEEYRWYYCQDPQGYYPYVRDCPGGWNAVSPPPPPPPPPFGP